MICTFQRPYLELTARKFRSKRSLILPFVNPTWRLVSRFQQKSRVLSSFSLLVETTSSSPSLYRLKKQAWNPGDFHAEATSVACEWTRTALRKIPGK